MTFHCQICGRPCSDDRWLAVGEKTYRFCWEHTARELVQWLNDAVFCIKRAVRQ